MHRIDDLKDLRIDLLESSTCDGLWIRTLTTTVPTFSTVLHDIDECITIDTHVLLHRAHTYLLFLRSHPIHHTTKYGDMALMMLYIKCMQDSTTALVIMSAVIFYMCVGFMCGSFFFHESSPIGNDGEVRDYEMMIVGAILIGLIWPLLVVKEVIRCLKVFFKGTIYWIKELRR